MPSEITSIIFEHCFKVLKKPVIRYTAEDTPVPVAPNLEKSYIPNVEKIVEYSKSCVVNFFIFNLINLLTININ